MAKMLVPDERVTTWIDISGDPLERKWDAIHEHGPRSPTTRPFMAFGLDGWREAWSKEAYILRESTVPTTATPEVDLFAGVMPPLVGQQALRGLEDLAHDDLAVAGRVEEVGLGLVEDDVRPHPDLDELGCLGT